MEGVQLRASVVTKCVHHKGRFNGLIIPEFVQDTRSGDVDVRHASCRAM